MMRIETVRPAHRLARSPQVKSKAPCGFLFNRNACPSREECPYSHDEEAVRRWQPQVCSFGLRCNYYNRGCCLKSHGPDDEQAKRGAKMIADLAEPVEIDVSRTAASPLERMGIEKEEHIASFNILKDGRIAVPGLPPVFNRPRRPLYCFRKDKNSKATEPEWPKFHPLVASVHFMRPELDISDLHVVTSAGCLRRIFRFLASAPERTERLNLEYRDGTLFMGRWSEDPVINTHFGFGMQFEQGTRSFEGGSEELRQSASHHRVIKYEIGGLKIVVQAELDGTDCECHRPGAAALPPQGEIQQIETPKVRRGHKARTLSGRFDALSLDDPGDVRGSSIESAIQTDPEIPGVIRAGTMVPSACGLEVKTSTKGRPNQHDYRPQLYFQRNTRVFQAFHERGTFHPDDMHTRDMTVDMQEWEAEAGNQRVLARLVTLLERVRSEARWRASQNGGGAQCKMGLVLGSCDVRDGQRGCAATLFLTREGEALVPQDL